MPLSRAAPDFVGVSGGHEPAGHAHGQARRSSDRRAVVSVSTVTFLGECGTTRLQQPTVIGQGPATPSADFVWSARNTRCGNGGAADLECLNLGELWERL